MSDLNRNAASAYLQRVSGGMAGNPNVGNPATGHCRLSAGETSAAFTSSAASCADYYEQSWVFDTDLSLRVLVAVTIDVTVGLYKNGTLVANVLVATTDVVGTKKTIAAAGTVVAAGDYLTLGWTPSAGTPTGKLAWSAHLRKT